MGDLHIWHGPVGQTSVWDLPIRLIEVDAGRHVKRLFDIVEDVPAGFNWREIAEHVRTHKMDRLEPPFCPKEPVLAPWRVQMIIVPQIGADGIENITLLKEYIVLAPRKISIVMPLIHGRANFVHSQGNNRGGPRALQYMLDT